MIKESLDIRELNYLQLCELFDDLLKDVDVRNGYKNEIVDSIHCSVKIPKITVVSLTGQEEEIEAISFSFNDKVTSPIQFNVYFGSSVFNMYDIPAKVDRYLRFIIRCKK